MCKCVAALMIAYFVIAYRDKAVGQWAKATGVLFVAAALAIGANSSSLYNTYEYSKETVRGKSSELTPLKPAEGSDSHNVNANGIDRDYITAWSYGVDETLTLLIPNVKGGATVKPNDVDDNGGLVAASVGDLSEAQEAIGNVVISDNPEENAALQPQLEATVGQFRQYFGDQPMTNGPVYVGALIFAGKSKKLVQPHIHPAIRTVDINLNIFITICLINLYSKLMYNSSY